MSHEIGIAVASFMKMLKPIDISLYICACHRVLPCEWRIPDDRVEPGVLSLEHLRKLDLPVERRERRVGVPPLLEPAAVALGFAAHDRVRILAPLRLPLLRLLCLEERRDHEIAEEPHLGELELRLVPQVAQLPVGNALVRLADPLAQLGDLRDVLAHLHRLEARLETRRIGIPVEGSRSACAKARRANRRAAARDPRR